MRELTIGTLGFGSSLLGYGHGHPVMQIAEAMGIRIVDERATKGFQIDDLCEGRISAGHIREAFSDEVPGVVDAAVRGLLPLSGRRAVHEYITSLPVTIGRDSNAIATDHNPDTPHVSHVLLTAVGSSDRQLLTDARWLTTGTRHDHSSPRAIPKRIEKIAKQLGRPVSGPLHEYIKEVLDLQYETRKRIALAYKNHHPAFARFGIDPHRFIKNCFPRCLIIESIPFGAPTKRLASSAGELFPGDDERVVAAVEAGKRYGVARCELNEPKVSLENLEDLLLPSLIERFGETPELISPERLEQVAAWAPARELGVGISIRFVRYWYFKAARRLLRAEQIFSPEGGEAVDVSLWRTIRLDGMLKPAVVLVERAQQVWPRSCILRFGRECAPGLCGSWKAGPRETILQLSLVPNACGVTAHRAMELRKFGR